jgi:hypothetical protein
MVMDESTLTNRKAVLVYLFSVDDSYAYGEALELRNVTDYEMLGKVDKGQALSVVENAGRFIAQCETFLTTKGYL